MKWMAGIILAAVSAAADGGTVFYSKSFPGSAPPYASVELQHNGSAVYKEAPDDDQPVTFKLSPEETSEIFTLAEKLDYFKRPLESNLKVANMGLKTLRYENGTASSEVKFNFSLDENAKLLVDVFEKITESQQLLFNLERTVKFDKLGVQRSLLQLEAAWDRKRLVAPERFLPLLDRVVKNDSYLNIARDRAAFLADAFRQPRTSATDPAPAAQKNKPRP
jgi:hypothetical protein